MDSYASSIIKEQVTIFLLNIQLGKTGSGGIWNHISCIQGECLNY